MIFYELECCSGSFLVSLRLVFGFLIAPPKGNIEPKSAGLEDVLFLFKEVISR